MWGSPSGLSCGVGTWTDPAGYYLFVEDLQAAFAALICFFSQSSFSLSPTHHLWRLSHAVNGTFLPLEHLTEYLEKSWPSAVLSFASNTMLVGLAAKERDEARMRPAAVANLNIFIKLYPLVKKSLAAPDSGAGVDSLRLYYNGEVRTAGLQFCNLGLSAVTQLLVLLVRTL